MSIILILILILWKSAFSSDIKKGSVSGPHKDETGDNISLYDNGDRRKLNFYDVDDNVVREFFDRGGKIEVILFYGRRRYTKIQLPYLLQNKRLEEFSKTALVSKINIVLNTNNTADIKYARSIANRDPKYLEIHEGFYGLNYCQFYPKFNSSNTYYIKIAVFDYESIRKAVLYEIAQGYKDALLTPLPPFFFDGDAFGDIGIYDIGNKDLDFNRYYRWSINFFLFDPKDLAKHRISNCRNDELWLSMFVPHDARKHSAAVGTALVSHFAYTPQ
eukprot:gene8682-17928_t